MSPRRRLEDDDEDESRSRRRPSERRRRPRKRQGMSSGARVGIIIGIVMGILIIIVVVLSLGGGLGGTPDGPPIDIEDFKKISKTDTIATIESRFGRGERVSSLDKIVFSISVRGHQAKIKQTLRDRLEKMYGVRDGVAYRWERKETSMFVVTRESDPKQTVIYKHYDLKRTDENGHFHGESMTESFIDPVGS